MHRLLHRCHSKRSHGEREYHHDEHEGHKVKSDPETLRDLRVLRGRQILSHVTKADGLAEQVNLQQLSFGLRLGNWKQTGRNPLSPAEGFVVSSAERSGPLGYL